MRTPLDLTLYLVTDARLCADVGVESTVAQAVAAGATAVQLRDPSCSDAQFVDLGRRLRRRLRSAGVPLIINNRVHLVGVIGADGAHVGQRDLGPAAAREVVGGSRHLGLSVHAVDQVRTALRLPRGTIDYLGVGPVWPQSTKSDAAPPCSAQTLAEITALSPWPCVAIGGVDASRVSQVRRAGAAGAAVVSAICGQQDVAAATRELRQAWEDQ